MVMMMLHVMNVLTNVLNVKIMLKTVTHVLLEDLQFQLVIVMPVLLKLTEFVNLVIQNVRLVKLASLIVKNVNTQESTLHSVPVHLVNSKMEKEYANNVTSLVLNVPDPLTIVAHVEVTESMNQLVNVQKVISKPMMINVQNVTTDVTLVKNKALIVLIVLKTEKKPQFVIVLMVLIMLKTKLLVQLVVKNVFLVLILRITVSSVKLH